MCCVSWPPGEQGWAVLFFLVRVEIMFAIRNHFHESKTVHIDTNMYVYLKSINSHIKFRPLLVYLMHQLNTDNWIKQHEIKKKWSATKQLYNLCVSDKMGVKKSSKNGKSHNSVSHIQTTKVYWIRHPGLLFFFFCCKCKTMTSLNKL